MKRALVACEFSGTVRRALRAAGVDAWSCDLLPAEDASPYHITGDAIAALNYGVWHLLIGHPPCTYLCNSGVRWLAPGGKVNAARYDLMKAGCDFFAALYWADVPHVAIENPVMHGYARDYLWSAYKVPTHSCTFQPWQHGEPEVKRSCLFLRNLPALVPSDIVAGREARVHRASPGPDRWKERSRTLPGVAAAMANQWSKIL